MSQPVPRSFNTHRCRTEKRSARGFELSGSGGIKRMQHGHGRAIERGVEFPPFTGWYHRARLDAHRLQHATNGDGIDWEDFTYQRNARCGSLGFKTSGAGYGSCLDLVSRIAEHGAGEHVLGLCVGRHAKTGDINTNDAYPVNLVGEQVQRHAGCCWYAEVNYHHRVVFVGVGQFVDRFADILKQLACDQRLRVEGHIAYGALGTVEVRGKGQAVNAAGRT